MSRIHVRWKEVVRELIRIHGEAGFALVPLVPDAHITEFGEAEPVTADDDLLRIYGRRLTMKPVKRFLWERRRDIRNPEHTFVWARYHPRRRTTYVGFGQITDAVPAN